VYVKSAKWIVVGDFKPPRDEELHREAPEVASGSNKQRPNGIGAFRPEENEVIMNGWWFGHYPSTRRGLQA